MSKKLSPPPVPPSMEESVGLTELRDAAADPTLAAMPTLSNVITPAHRRFETLVTDTLDRIDDITTDAKKGFDDNIKVKPEIAIKFQRNQLHAEHLRVKVLSIAADMVIKEKSRAEAEIARKDAANGSVMNNLPPDMVAQIAGVLGRRSFEAGTVDVTPKQ